MEKDLEDVVTELEKQDDKYDLPTLPSDDEVDWDNLDVMEDDDEIWDNVLDDYYEDEEDF